VQSSQQITEGMSSFQAERGELESAMSSRKKPGVAFWATVVVVVLLAYPISFGPACWITSRLNRGADLVPVVYRPLTWALSPDDDTAINRVGTWYAKIGAPEDWEWIPISLETETLPDGTLIGEFGGWTWASTSPFVTPPPAMLIPPPPPSPPYSQPPVLIEPGDSLSGPKVSSGGHD